MLHNFNILTIGHLDSQDEETLCATTLEDPLEKASHIHDVTFLLRHLSPPTCYPHIATQDGFNQQTRMASPLRTQAEHSMTFSFGKDWVAQLLQLKGQPRDAGHSAPDADCASTPSLSPNSSHSGTATSTPQSDAQYFQCRQFERERLADEKRNMTEVRCASGKQSYLDSRQCGCIELSLQQSQAYLADRGMATYARQKELRFPLPAQVDHRNGPQTKRRQSLRTSDLVSLHPLFLRISSHYTIRGLMTSTLKLKYHQK